MSYASQFASLDEYEKPSDDLIERKRSSMHMKTQRNRPAEMSDKAKSVLASIHAQPEGGDDDAPAWNPPPPPVSVGAQRAAEVREGLAPMDAASSTAYMTYDAANLGDTADYYRKLEAQHRRQTRQPSIINPSSHPPAAALGNDPLMQKLNYMIHLLEEKREERVGDVTEQVVLYSFLGVFIIFVVDSFARVGKYRR
jgi:hypothetical protein